MYSWKLSTIGLEEQWIKSTWAVVIFTDMEILMYKDFTVHTTFVQSSVHMYKQKQSESLIVQLFLLYNITYIYNENYMKC